MDFGKKFRDRRIFGDHKTWRGLVAGFVASLLLFLGQSWLFSNTELFREFSLVNYESLNPIIMALVFTLGALGGDAVESFFKRQIGIKPGDSWFPFDQLDWVIGVLLLSTLVVDLKSHLYILALFIGLVLHPAVKFIAWLLKIEDKPF
jgi:CDP-2,3-bis-(O-geranylgeranyl)-sn-glycerol synthase